MGNELLTAVTTHEIHYKVGDKYECVKVTEDEAREATKQWKNRKPVPVPNKKDEQRSCMVLHNFNIEMIKRFRYIGEE
ncbi:MAG: hypothetical protein DRP02_02210 [Candidatus Gerdarchaeota archaeon]|nr:MAG: hypothetical protein DRP02_02210 [Candidatus Gerdarchaeota archaeon]